MAVIVEDGDGITDANSYVDVEYFATYAENNGWDISAYDEDTAVGPALIRATKWIDAAYRSEWPGVRTYGRDQWLQWPRRSGSIINGIFVADDVNAVTDSEGIDIDEDEIPEELMDAVCEAAYRELLSPGALAPDLDRGGMIASVKAGSAAVTYASGAPVTTTFTVIDNILSGLISPPSQADTVYTGLAVRG